MDISETDALISSGGIENRKKLFAEFFMSHRQRLRLLVELRLDRRLRKRLDPSDILQETFIEASERLDDYLKSPAVPLMIWLRFLTGQKILTHHRKHLGSKRDARKDISIFQGTMPATTSEDLAKRLMALDDLPCEAVIQAEREKRLQTAFDQMDPLDREVISLRHFEQLNLEECAQVLGMKAGSVSKRYLRALKKLRTILEHLPGGMDEP